MEFRMPKRGEATVSLGLFWCEADHWYGTAHCAAFGLYQVLLASSAFSAVLQNV